ncbi:hypothetical protein D9M70_370270 [compost metagenome]
MADAQHRLGDRGDQGDVVGGDQHVAVQGGGLARLAEHVEGALVGEGLVADGQGEEDLDAAAVEAGVDVVGEGEDQRVAGADAHRYRAFGIGVAGAQAPDRIQLVRIEDAEVEQRQRQVGGQREVLVVAGDQVVAEAEGDLIARVQLDAGRRGAAAVEVGQGDVHLAGRHGAGGARAVALVAAGEVEYVLEDGGGDRGAVADVVALVDLAVRLARWRRIALPDERLVADQRRGGALQHVVEGQVAVEPAADAEGVGQRLADVEGQGEGAVAIVGDHGGEGDDLRRAVEGHRQGRRVRHQGLAVAERIDDDEAALAQEVPAEGEVVGNGDVQVVGQGIARGQAGAAEVGLQGDLLEQGDGLGDEADLLALAAEGDAGAGSDHVARVERLPFAAGGGPAEGDGHGVAADRAEHRVAVGIVVRHEELHVGGGRAGQLGIADGELADVQVVRQVGVAVLEQDGLDQLWDDDRASVVEGDRGDHAAGRRGNGGDDDVARHRLGDRHVAQRLRAGRVDGHVQFAAVVRAGGGFAFGRGDHLVEGDHRRVHHVAVGGAGFEDARVGRRVVQRVVAVLEAAARADGQVRGRAGEGEVGVGQVAEAGDHLDGDGRLALADAGKRQFEHHHLVAGAHAEVGGVDHQRLAVGADRQGVERLAVGVEGEDVGGQGLARIAGGDEGDAVVDLGAGAVPPGGREEQVDEGRVAGVGGAVGEGHGEGEGAAEQHVGTAGEVRGGAGDQQPVVAGQVGGGEGDGLVDLAAADFQFPVAAGRQAAGIVVGGGDVGAGPARQLVDQGPPGAAGADLAAVQLDVGPFAEVVAPLLQALPELADVVAADAGAAQGELAGAAVGEDLDRVDLAQRLQRLFDGGDAVLSGLDHQGLHAGRQLAGELLAVFDAAVDHQQVPGAALGRRLGRRGRRMGGVSVVDGVVVLLIGRDRRRAVEQNPGFEGEGMGLRSERSPAVTG